MDMDPEQVAIDNASVALATAERFGRGLLFHQQTERNIPHVYERPGRWPIGTNIGAIPSVAAGIVSGPSRTVHPQSHLGPSWNLPAILTMRNDVLLRQPVVGQIMSQIRDRLRLMGRR